MSLNKVILLGRLGGNPELSYTPSGVACCAFSVATTEIYKDQKKTEWHRIIVWGKLGEICNQYLKKGNQVLVEGKIQTRTWEDKEGAQRWSTEIIAIETKFLSD